MWKIVGCQELVQLTGMLQSVQEWWKAQASAPLHSNALGWSWVESLCLQSRLHCLQCSEGTWDTKIKVRAQPTPTDSKWIMITGKSPVRAGCDVIRSWEEQAVIIAKYPCCDDVIYSINCNVWAWDAPSWGGQDITFDSNVNLEKQNYTRCLQLIYWYDQKQISNT